MAWSECEPTPVVTSNTSNFEWSEYEVTPTVTQVTLNDECELTNSYGNTIISELNVD